MITKKIDPQTEIKIDWNGFMRSDFDKALEEGPLYEDNIYGIVDTVFQDKAYLVDIHFEGNEDFCDEEETEPQFDLEIYRLRESGLDHGEWLGSVKSKEIVSMTYEDFCKTVETLVHDYLALA